METMIHWPSFIAGFMTWCFALGFFGTAYLLTNFVIGLVTELNDGD